ncbi:MAG: hypothetical protein ACLFWL_16125 [Candidatus Brocadiia bacterium]
MSHISADLDMHGLSGHRKDHGGFLGYLRNLIRNSPFLFASLGIHLFILIVLAILTVGSIHKKPANGIFSIRPCEMELP